MKIFRIKNVEAFLLVFTLKHYQQSLNILLMFLKNIIHLHNIILFYRYLYCYLNQHFKLKHNHSNENKTITIKFHPTTLNKALLQSEFFIFFKIKSFY